MGIFQIIPLLCLAVYFLYITYYIAIPMFCLKVLLFIGYRKYHCSEIYFREDGIIVTYLKDKRICHIVKDVEDDPDSRFFIMSLCSALKKTYKDIREERSVLSE